MSLQIPRQQPLTQLLKRPMIMMMMTITMIYTNLMKTIMIQVKVQIQNLAHIELILIGAQLKLTIVIMKIHTPGLATDFSLRRNWFHS